MAVELIPIQCPIHNNDPLADQIFMEQHRLTPDSLKSFLRKICMASLCLVLCFNLGCDTVKDTPKDVENGKVTDPTEPGSSSKTEVDGSSTKTEDSVSKSNSADATTVVDHNDPTSYPVTKLAPKTANQILMLSWNVESNGAEAETVCAELTEMNKGDRYDIVTLSEVLPEDLSKFRNALGQHYKYKYSKSGHNDRLQILYNENRFKKIRDFEIDEINIKGRYRAPTVVHLKERKTDSRPDEIEFLVMVNHLARGKAEIRQEQATMLVEWARKQNLPLFALGDYNFDYVFETDKGNPAFTSFMTDNIFRWVAPQEMVDTNWYDDPEEPDGKDDYPGSMLDFAFVAGSAKDWKSSCQIIVRENDFPDDEKTSDHRPFELVVEK